MKRMALLLLILLMAAAVTLGLIARQQPGAPAAKEHFTTIVTPTAAP